MVKKEYQEVTHTITETIEVGRQIICDQCNTPITSHYWTLCTHHSDWDNDSVDSFEYKDLCSPECIHEELVEYFKRSNNNYNTEEFELEHVNYTA